MRYPFNTFFVSALLLLLQNSLFASDVFHTGKGDEFVPVYYTTENGLPQNTPAAIAQTSDGYLWLATFGGLARFDGLTFKTFTSYSNPEIITNRLTALFRDDRDTLWIGSETGDLMTYKHGKFSLVRANPGKDIKNRITSLFIDKDFLWIGTHNGLFTYDLNTHEYKSRAPETFIKNSDNLLEGFIIRAFAKDVENNLWIASNSGLIRYKDEKFTNFDKSDGLPADTIMGLKATSEGTLWILTTGSFGKYENGRHQSILNFESGDISLPLVVNNDNSLLFNISDNLYEYRDNRLFSHNISNLVSTDITSLFFDSERNLWLGTNDGLILLKKRFIEVYAYRPRENWSPAQSVIQDRTGTIWTASSPKIINWRENVFKLISLDPAYSRAPLSSLALDRDDGLWIGTADGILKYENGKFVKIENPKLPYKQINALYFDKSGALWIGTGDCGLHKYADGAAASYTLGEGLGSSTVSYITEDSKGAIWVGTLGGLSKIENGQLINFTLENNAPINFVREIYEDADGALWIGTYGSGLFRLKNGSFSQITTKNGLAENIVSRILTDDRDNFWILGNQGIYTVSRKALDSFADGATDRVFCTVYGKKDGMKTGEGNGGSQPSGWKAGDGKLWFAMISGAVIIDPKEVNYHPPPVYIEQISLEQKELSPRGQIEISPGQRNLSINYTGINFAKPDQVQFRYKLEGFDRDWQYVGTRRTAFYPYLPPGRYKFIVSAVIGEQWSRNEAIIDIRVLSPYWHKWWFWLVVLAGIIGLIVLFYQRRLVKVQQSRLRQQEFSRRLINAHESERQRIAVELHDGLGQSLLVIKNWALLGLKESPENKKLDKFLNEISETASNALDETRSIAHNLRPQHLQRFGLKAALENMTATVGESSGIYFETRIEEIDDLLTEEAETYVFRIVQECLNNIVKHSDAETAVIEVYRLAKTFNISIKDFGKGFNVKPHQNPRNPNIDFGINNIIQKVELLSGKFAIDSRPGEGTKIFISLNLP